MYGGRFRKSRTAIKLGYLLQKNHILFRAGGAQGWQLRSWCAVDTGVQRPMPPAISPVLPGNLLEARCKGRNTVGCRIAGANTMFKQAGWVCFFNYSTGDPGAARQYGSCCRPLRPLSGVRYRFLYFHLQPALTTLFRKGTWRLWKHKGNGCWRLYMTKRHMQQALPGGPCCMWVGVQYRLMIPCFITNELISSSEVKRQAAAMQV